MFKKGSKKELENLELNVDAYKGLGGKYTIFCYTNQQCEGKRVGTRKDFHKERKYLENSFIQSHVKRGE